MSRMYMGVDLNGIEDRRVSRALRAMDTYLKSVSADLSSTQLQSEVVEAFLRSDVDDTANGTVTFSDVNPYIITQNDTTITIGSEVTGFGASGDVDVLYKFPISGVFNTADIVWESNHATPVNMKLQLSGAAASLIGNVGLTLSAPAVELTSTTSGMQFDVASGSFYLFNPNNADTDFKVNGDTITNLFFIDAGTDRVGINTGTPGALLDVQGASILGGNVTIGAGAAGVDYTITVNGETTDGVITWMEDEDVWSFADTITITDATAMSLSSTTPTVTFGDGSSGTLTFSGANTFANIVKFEKSGGASLQYAFTAGAITCTGVGPLTQNVSGGLAFTATTGNLNFASTLGSITFSAATAGQTISLNSGGVDADTIIEGASDTELVYVDAGNDRVGISTSTPGGLLDVDQGSTTAAIPTLYVRQADVSEEFVRFQGSAAAATLTQSIVAEADVSTATRAGFVKVHVIDDGDQITDQAYFMPIYTLA